MPASREDAERCEVLELEIAAEAGLEAEAAAKAEAEAEMAAEIVAVLRQAASEGLALERAAGTASGYRGVKPWVTRTSTRFEARYRRRCLGSYPSAEEAALVYARAKARCSEEDTAREAMAESEAEEEVLEGEVAAEAAVVEAEAMVNSLMGAAGEKEPPCGGRDRKSVALFDPTVPNATGARCSCSEKRARSGEAAQESVQRHRAVASLHISAGEPEVELHRSDKSSTGFKNVYRHRSKFIALVKKASRNPVIESGELWDWNWARGMPLH